MEINDKNDIIKKVADAYKNPEKGTEDINGNTKLTVLQEKFGLSSLKVQKILITADVYEPVRKNTNYEKVKRLREQGKSVEEISDILGISKAAACAYLPYENGVYNADVYGDTITPNAVRKRRQRAKADDRRLASRNMLLSGLTDESFWNTLKKHETEVFYSLHRQRYSIKVNNDDDLEIIIKRSDRKEDDLHEVIPKENVIGLLHEAIDLKTSVQNEIVEKFESEQKKYADSIKKPFSDIPDLTVSPNDLLNVDIIIIPDLFKNEFGLAFVYPLLVYFGIIGGNVHQYVAKKTVMDMKTCSCCGRNKGMVFPASNYNELNHSCYEMLEKKRANGGSLSDDEKEELLSRGTKYEITYDQYNDIIKSFDTSDHNRSLCIYCMRPIRNALFNGMKAFEPMAVYENATIEELQRIYENSLVQLHVQSMDAAGRKLPVCTKALPILDAHGTEHLFVVTTDVKICDDGKTEFTVKATEIHLLTRAGKIAANSAKTNIVLSNTRYVDAETFKDIQKKQAFIGRLELIDKLKTVVGGSCLTRVENADEHTVTKANINYNIGAKGSFAPIITRDDITGDITGNAFLIDGITFTGDETAKLFDKYNGKYLCYGCFDVPLADSEYLKKVDLNGESLLRDTKRLINMFCKDGAFISPHDKENFGILFVEIIENIRLYNSVAPGGYARLAAMQLITELAMIKDSERFTEQIHNIIDDV